jgi:hypothetical protein
MALQGDRLLEMFDIRPSEISSLLSAMLEWRMVRTLNLLLLLFLSMVVFMLYLRLLPDSQRPFLRCAFEFGCVVEHWQVHEERLVAAPTPGTQTHIMFLHFHILFFIFNWRLGVFCGCMGPVVQRHARCWSKRESLPVSVI